MVVDLLFTAFLLFSAAFPGLVLKHRSEQPYLVVTFRYFVLFLAVTQGFMLLSSYSRLQRVNAASLRTWLESRTVLLMLQFTLVVCALIAGFHSFTGVLFLFSVLLYNACASYYWYSELGSCVLDEEKLALMTKQNTQSEIRMQELKRRNQGPLEEIKEEQQEQAHV